MTGRYSKHHVILRKCPTQLSPHRRSNGVQPPRNKPPIQAPQTQKKNMTSRNSRARRSIESVTAAKTTAGDACMHEPYVRMQFCVPVLACPDRSSASSACMSHAKTTSVSNGGSAELCGHNPSSWPRPRCGSSASTHIGKVLTRHTSPQLCHRTCMITLLMTSQCPALLHATRRSPAT